MKILGLTGSIGMGKTATAQMFRALDVPVYDADAEVHALYQAGGGAVGPLSERFEGIVQNGAIDRTALRVQVIANPVAMSDLEAIVHPLVRETQVRFRAQARASGAGFAVLDIPLLYETGGEAYCDHVAVVSAPADMQRDRVLGRGVMTPDEFEAILAKQMSDAEKRARADFIISTAFGFDFARAHVAAIATLMGRVSDGENT